MRYQPLLLILGYLWIGAVSVSAEPTVNNSKERELVRFSFEGDLANVCRLSKELGTVEVNVQMSFKFKPKTGGVYYMPDGWTPLTAALVGKQWVTAAYLLGLGADVNHTTTSKYSPLWYAVTSGNHNDSAYSIIDLLLSRGAKNSTLHTGLEPGEYGETVMDRALINSDLRIVKLFLKHGIDIHEKNPLGTTIFERYDKSYSVLYDNGLNFRHVQEDPKEVKTIRSLMLKAAAKKQETKKSHAVPPEKSIREESVKETAGGTQRR